MTNFSERENKQRRSLSKSKNTFDKWLRIYPNWKSKKEYRTKMWYSRTCKKYSRTEEVSRAVLSRLKNNQRTSFLKTKDTEWVFRYRWKMWDTSSQCKKNTTATVTKTLSTTWGSSLKRYRTDRLSRIIRWRNIWQEDSRNFIYESQYLIANDTS